jgi:antitoxin component YwqK of YwqJK toxin-antitoxin module
MKNYNFIIYFLIFIFSNSVFAQKDTIWYDANWGKTVKAQASYFRPAPVKKDNGFLLVDYYLSGVKQMQAFSLKLDEELFDGEVVWYYENGKVMQTVNYKSNVLIGKRKNYHESGPLKSQYSYTDGKIAGDWVSYFENSKLSESGKYENGERNRSWKEYYKNGKLKGEGNYANDKKVGVWKMYYYDGIEEE